MAFLTGAGRVGRLHYLLVNVGCTIGIFVPFLLGTTVDPATGEAAPMPAAMGLLLVLMWLAGMWVGVANAIRRFHDCGRSGWLVLLCVVPLLGAAAGLYLLFNPGDPLPNAYGPPPGAPDPNAMRAQLAQLEAVTAPYRQAQQGDGADDGDPRAPAPSAWAADALTFDPDALYRENPGLAPPR